MTGRITTPYPTSATAEDVLAGLDLTGRRVVVTGGASGIGRETSTVLARHGADVTLAVRDVGRGGPVAEEIGRQTGNPAVRAAYLDLSDLGSVRAFAAEQPGPLHVLVNNAGVMALPERELAHGRLEQQFVSNFLGHFALASWLRDRLAEAGGRIVAVSSSAHLFSPVVFDDLGFDFRPYDPRLAYAQSKTAVTLFAVGAEQHWSTLGITANALNPGAIATPLQRHVGGVLATPPAQQKSVAQGAATTVLLAAHPSLDGVSGRYFSDNQEARVVDRRPDEVVKLNGSVARYALDAGNADRLWGLAQSLIA